MSIITAYTMKDLPAGVADIKSQGRGASPGAVICFASAKYDPTELSRLMQEAFPNASVVGCTTAGELSAGKMMSGSISAMLLDSDIVEKAAVGVVEDLGGAVRIDAAFSALEMQLGEPVESLDTQKHVGLILIDGLSGAEEALMDKIGDRTDLFFVGGSAGDDLKFERTHVLAGGRAYSSAAVLLVLKVKRGFDIIKTQSFLPTGKALVATKVDERLRCVLEFDNKPALDAYAEALGVARSEAPALFMSHPLGLMADGEPFVRSPQKVLGTSIYFYCQILQGMELQVLRATDIVAGTKVAIDNRKAAGPPIEGIIDFQCILRTLQLRSENRCEQYGDLFDGIPMAGFSTYGEAYLGHINQTSTMLVFH